MSYRIALNFEDGVTRFIDCNPGEKVLDAAFRARVNLPMDCSDGVCGTCKCRAESGSYDLGEDYIEDALTEDEALADLLMGDELRAGLYSFDLVQKRAKRPAGAPDKSLARKVTKVGIVGAGLAQQRADAAVEA